MENGYVVYLDVVFLINFLMDFAILWATSKFGHFKTSKKRLALAALLGSTYTLALFLPELNWLFTYGMKFVFSLLMVAIAFFYVSWKRFLAAIGYFYMVAFATAGAMLGAVYFFDSNAESYSVLNGILVSLSNIKASWLLAGLAVVVLVGRFGAGYLKKSFLASLLHVSVVIRFGNKSVPVKALLDTGNQLKDPLTQHPVMVVEYSVLKKILPEAVRQAFETGEEPELEKLSNLLTDMWWAKRLRLIPFNSIGEKSSMMLAFRPDLVFIQMEEKLVEVRQVVVAVCNRSLSPEGLYRALLHLDMLRETLKT